MIAECDKCGTDLVYGERPEMFYEPCTLRARISLLESVVEAARAHRARCGAAAWDLAAALSQLDEVK